MITCLVLVVLFVLIAAIVAVLTGLVAISPIILGLFCLPIVDYLVIKMIFKKKKKGDKEGR